MKVVVTRARAQARPLADRLEELGHEVVECPLIEVEPLGDEPIDTSEYDWVIVTSPNGARELVRRQVGELSSVAAIAPGTAAALAEHGIRPDLVAELSTQEGLAGAFERPPRRALVAAAVGARRTLAEELGAEFLPLYRTVELTPAERPEGDLVLLASPSAARAFARLDADIPAVSIGPETTRAARAAGVAVLAEAPTHDLDGLIAAVTEACSSLS